jgi:fucokinase
MTQAGTTAFLRQAHRNNWEQYLASLKSGAQQDWDICVLTASDERQAEMYRSQLDWRRESGLLPHGMQTLVLPDPGGRRIGSGGATLNALAQVAGLVAESDAGRLETLQRVLLIHSGGDSKRLPHCSASGKLFARVPRVLPDGRASTIFDELLIGLSGLATQLPPGVLIASGDVLLVFDHMQLSGAFRRPGVIGVAAAAAAEMGRHHGVYVSGDGGHRVRAYLHKPSAEELARWEAMGEDGAVQIDTGLVWLDAPTAERFVSLSRNPAIAAATLNLYGDLLMPLSGSTAFEPYLADTSDGPATLAVQAARHVIWEQVRGTPFGVERLQPAVFVHFGSSREYWRMAAGNPGLADLCGWTAQAAAWLDKDQAEDARVVLINTAAEAPIRTGELPVLLMDSRLAAETTCDGAAIVAGVQTHAPLHLAPDIVLHQMPVAGGAFVTRLLALDDDPKKRWDTRGATFVGRPWESWLADAGAPAEQVWPHTPASQRSLWNARLYPLAPDREQSLHLALPLQNPASAPPGWLDAWLAAPRLSLAEGAAQADGPRLLAELLALEDTVAILRFGAAVEAEQPAAEAKALLGAAPGVVRRRAQRAGDRWRTADPILQIRGFKALSEATGARIWEDRAFNTLAGMIERATLTVAGPTSRTESANRRPILVRAAARIDLGGGWTDTPPHSIERGGTVLNAALTLRGEHPIVAEAVPLAEPRLILASRDLDTAFEPRLAGEVLAYANPADPFALHKAALVLRGVVPSDADPAHLLADLLRDGGGLRLSTGAHIPLGSGLGTSSILAGAVLTALSAVGREETRERGSGAAEENEDTSPPARHLSYARLFDEVLCLEQMLTTGGGWQDQVGGLIGGVKLVTTPPGLPQRITVQPVSVAPAAAEAFGQRLLLVYTGQQRLAKNLLRAITGRWMGRDREMVFFLSEIAGLALAMREALLAGDLDTFGALLAEHWTINKRMDPGCTNPFIDELFETLWPYICGGKLAGAGGGGFVIAMAREPEAVAALSAALAARYPGTPVAVWPCAVPDNGLHITVER